MDAILRYTAAEINEMLAKLKAGGAVTPSGDPMHYTYIAAYPDLEFDETTGLWSYCKANGGLTDLTTDEVRLIFARSGSGVRLANTESQFFLDESIRTNFALRPADADWGHLTVSSVYRFLYCRNMSVAVVDPGHLLFVYAPNKCQGMFYSCDNLRTVIGKIDLFMAAGSLTEMFYRCSSLESVRIARLRSDLSLADSPLGVESATYLLENADASATFTVTFRADRQAIYEADTDFVAAKNAHPNITILYQ